MEQRWVRVIGTNKAFQFVKAFEDRIGVDMIEITKSEAVRLTKELDAENIRNATKRQQIGGSASVQSQAPAQSPLLPPEGQAPVVTADVGTTDPTKPLSPEAADVDEPTGPGMAIDDLDDMTKADLVAVIEKEGLEVPRSGSRAKLTESVRAARAARASAPAAPAE